MNRLYFDCSVGAAGDMLLAAVLDVLVKESRIKNPLAEWHSLIEGALKQEVDGRYTFKEVTKAGFAAKKIDFFVADTHSNDFHSKHHRHYADIKAMLEDLRDKKYLDVGVYELSLKIFEVLAKAEAKVHETSIEFVHFHEVGAFDSIMDIVGFAAALKLANVQEIICSDIGVGSGTVIAAHGEMAVPTPAVAEIINTEKLNVAGFELKGECLTPTGACILAAVVNNWSEVDDTKFKYLGIGAGSRENSYPNVVKCAIL